MWKHNQFLVYLFSFFFWKILRRGQRKWLSFFCNNNNRSRWMFLLMNALILSFFWFLCGNIIHIFFFNFFLLFVITQTWLYLDLSNATACNFFMKVFFLDLISVNILCLVEYIIFYRRLSDWRVIQVPMSLKLAEEWTCESTPCRLTTSFFLKKIKMIKEREI